MFQQKMEKYKSIRNKHKDKNQYFSDSDESETETGNSSEQIETIEI